MSLNSVMNAATKLAAWATPHIKDWHRQRNLDRMEGERHFDAGNFSEAEKHLVIAVEQVEQRAGSSKKRSALRLLLAAAQREQGKWAEAESNTRLALESAGGDRALHGDALESLSDLLFAREDFKGAQSAMREAVELSMNEEGLALRTHKLARSVYKAGNPKEAQELYQQAIDLHEEAFGAADTHTAAVVGELGTIQREQGKHDDAQKNLRRALKIHEESLGKDSREATEDLAQLASSLEESGDLDGALAEYERVLRRKEQQIGGSMDDLADTQVRVARMYVHWGQHGKARQLLAQAIPALSRKPDKRLAVAFETMAQLEESSGRREVAVVWRDKASAITAQPV